MLVLAKMRKPLQVLLVRAPEARSLIRLSPSQVQISYSVFVSIQPSAARRDKNSEVLEEKSGTCLKARQGGGG